MSLKSVSVQVLFRDAEGEVVGIEVAEGTTENDGATVTVGLGYLPNILTAAPGDILRTVHQPAVEVAPPSALPVRTDNVEENTSTLAF